MYTFLFTLFFYKGRFVLLTSTTVKDKRFPWKPVCCQGNWLTHFLLWSAILLRIFFHPNPLKNKIGKYLGNILFNHFYTNKYSIIVHAYLIFWTLIFPYLYKKNPGNVPSWKYIKDIKIEEVKYLKLLTPILLITKSITLWPGQPAHTIGWPGFYHNIPKNDNGQYQKWWKVDYSI